MKTRKYSRVGYKCCDGNYYEDTYGRRITPVEVRELPLEELNSYQKRLIGALCRRFAAEGAERVTEELDKLQYCSLETALRVAQNGGYLPQDTLNDMEELKMAQSLMSDEAMIEMIGLYMQRAKPSELAEKYNLDVKQVSNLIYRAKSDDKYKHLFTDKTEKTTEEQDKRFEEILDSIDAGAEQQENGAKQPENVAGCPENDIDRAAEAIDNYLEEQKLTGDIKDVETTAPRTFTARGEGLIEAVNGRVFVNNYNLTRVIAEQLADNFVGTFYGSVTVHFEVLEKRDVFEFEIK